MPPQQEQTPPSSTTPTSSSPPLRICVYGSSSSKTPQPYLNAAKSLGHLLATHNHTCVNGAGSHGCMAALNDGCHEGNGNIVGVIHEMFIVDGSDWCTSGAHEVFHDVEIVRGGDEAKGEKSKSKRQILVAGGDDLQERKKLLVKGADALMVLPGGPGTWDELWEMACARNLGLTDVPIVCININGYYDGFKTMLQRGHTDELLYNVPSDIVHFEDSVEEALQWVEDTVSKTKKEKEEKQKEESTNVASSSDRKKIIQKRESAIGGTSYWKDSIIHRSASWVGGKLIGSNGGSDGNDDADGYSSSFLSIDEEEEEEEHEVEENEKALISTWMTSQSVVTFVTGIVLGVVLSTNISNSKMTRFSSFKL